MSDQEQQVELDKLPYELRLEFYKTRKVVDITSGLHHLIANGTELSRFVVDMLLQKEHSRFPIIGFKDGSIYMLGGDQVRLEHRQILIDTGHDDSDILFATSIEGLNNRAQPPYLEAMIAEDQDVLKSGEVFRFPIGKGTDLTPAGDISRPGGREILEKIFGQIEGITIVTPDYYGRENK